VDIAHLFAQISYNLKKNFPPLSNFLLTMLKIFTQYILAQMKEYLLLNWDKKLAADC
jgi:hypothetical protein